MTLIDSVKKIEDALIVAHQNRPEIEADNGWNKRVMARVYAQGRLFAKDRDPNLTQRFVWRFAAVTCMFALFLSLYALQTGIGPEQFTLRFLVDDPLALQALPLVAL